jgi:LPS export ABC transporter protein LptC
MKPRQSDQDKEEPQPPGRSGVSFGRICTINLILMFAGVCFTACENDLDKIHTITSIDHIPDASGKKYEILYSDSFRVRVRILAPEIERYARLEEPCIKFPKGMTAYFYNDSLKIEAYIKAKDVVYFEKDNLWEAKNNVEGRNLANGNQINTEHMFWDERKHLIYSNTRSRIVNEEGTFYGENGFEARQDLSWYRLKKSKGIVTVKDE